MRFNNHSEYVGKHAFLSASNHHWVRYDEEKLASRFFSALAAVKGTELHDIAQKLINLRIKQIEDPPTTLSLYVNDGIGFRMSTEQVLFVSPNCFGTADTISFRQNMLRIHDLKNGVSKTSIEQLEVYAAMFCLEYGMRPFDIEIELRIYQNNEVRVYTADPIVISRIMDQIIIADRQITQMRLEANS